MPVAIGLGFNVDSNEPIDNRMVVADEAERLAIPWFNRYEGLIIYQQDTNVVHVITDPGDATTPATFTRITTSDVAIFPHTGSAIITGSLSVIGPTTITAPTSSIINPENHLFLIRTTDSDESKFVVNLEGVTVLGEFDTTPQPVRGGMFFSSSGDFYLGS